MPKLKNDGWWRGARWVILAALVLGLAQRAPAQAAPRDNRQDLLAALYQIFLPAVMEPLSTAGGAPADAGAAEATATPAPTEGQPLGATTYKTFLPLTLKPYQQPTDNFFGTVGTSVDALDYPGYPGMLDSNAPLRNKSFYWLEQTGMEYFRTYGSDSRIYSWRFVNPANNTYDWSKWDLLVQSAQDHNITILASIGNGVPQWANGTTDWRHKPNDLWTDPWETSSWYKYVYAFVERYDGDGINDMPGLHRPLKYIEFWNEPDLRQGWLCEPTYNPCPPNIPPAHQFDGDVNDYVRLSQVGYAAAKAASSNAVIVGPATAQTAGGSELEGGPYHMTYFIWSWVQWMQAGGLNYVDIVSFTRYPDQPDWDAINYVDYFLAFADGNRGGKPVWLTETGWGGSSTDSNQTKASNFARFTFEVWSRPFVERFFWYSYHEPQFGQTQSNGFPANDSAAKALVTTTVNADGNIAEGVEPDPYFHPLYRAVEVLLDVFSAYNAKDHPVDISPNSNVRVYRFDKNGQTTWAAWIKATSGSQQVSINTDGRMVRMISLFGEDLGTFTGGNINLGPWPIYLTTNLNWNQDIGRITGRVRTSAQTWTNGVVGVTVQASNGSLTVQAQTDSDGNYSFTGLPEGSYTVTVLGQCTTPPSRSVTVDREARWGRTSFTTTGC